MCTLFNVYSIIIYKLCFRAQSRVLELWCFESHRETCSTFIELYVRKLIYVRRKHISAPFADVAVLQIHSTLFTTVSTWLQKTAFIRLLIYTQQWKTLNLPATQQQSAYFRVQQRRTTFRRASTSHEMCRKRLARVGENSLERCNYMQLPVQLHSAPATNN